MISRTQIKDASSKIICRSSDTISSSSSSLVDDDWLVFEVLTRLPVKSLFRFKSVCKRWCSLIQKDQNFIESHLLLNLSRLRRLFIVISLPGIIRREKKVYDKNNRISCISLWPYEEIYITAELKLFGDEDKRVDASARNVFVVDTLRKVDSTEYDRITNPVNGLICLIDSRFKYAVSICNISTRELSPWFESSLLSGEKERNGIPCCRMKNYDRVEPNYLFGFDPFTNEHKLVCVWIVISKGRQRQYLICEVLTVGRRSINGDIRWRRIKEVPEVPYGIGRNSVCVNGIIYWRPSDRNFSSWGSENRPIYIMAFDIGREKFRKITVSDFILDQPPHRFPVENHPLGIPLHLHCECVQLLEVSGRLAMLVRMNNCMFKMYMYENDDYKLDEDINRTPIGSSDSFSSNNNGRWSEASTITLPSTKKKNCVGRFCTFSGSDDEIIFTSSEELGCHGKVGKDCDSFYSYNWKKGCWRELDVSSSSVPHLCKNRFVTTFSESLLPVNNDKDVF